MTSSLFHSTSCLSRFSWCIYTSGCLPPLSSRRGGATCRRLDLFSSLCLLIDIQSILYLPRSHRFSFLCLSSCEATFLSYASWLLFFLHVVLSFCRHERNDLFQSVSPFHFFFSTFSLSHLSSSCSLSSSFLFFLFWSQRWEALSRLWKRRLYSARMGLPDKAVHSGNLRYSPLQPPPPC